MASKYWIKLYHEILHDPKMGRMSDTLWRRTIELFLLAGEIDQDGVLPSVEEMTWTLRISEAECNETLHELQRLRIVHCNDNGEWVVTKFCDRQSAANNTERSRQFRQRKQREKRMQPLRQTKNEPESSSDEPIEAPKEPEPEVLVQSLPETEVQRNVAPDTDTDTDTDSLPKGKGDKSPPNSKSPNESFVMFKALTDLCQIDTELIGKGEKDGWFKAAKTMRDNGYTPADIESFGVWWYANDWRGKQNQPPTQKQIKSTWGQFKRSLAQNGASANETSKRNLDRLRAELEADIARIERDRAAAGASHGAAHI